MYLGVIQSNIIQGGIVQQQQQQQQQPSMIIQQPQQQQQGTVIQQGAIMQQATMVAQPQTGVISQQMPHFVQQTVQQQVSIDFIRCFPSLTIIRGYFYRRAVSCILILAFKHLLGDGIIKLECK